MEKQKIEGIKIHFYQNLYGSQDSDSRDESTDGEDASGNDGDEQLSDGDSTDYDSDYDDVLRTLNQEEMEENLESQWEDTRTFSLRGSKMNNKPLFKSQEKVRLSKVAEKT